MQVRILKVNTVLYDMIYDYPKIWRVKYYTYFVIKNVKAHLKH